MDVATTTDQYARGKSHRATNPGHRVTALGPQLRSPNHGHGAIYTRSHSWDRRHEATVKGLYPRGLSLGTAVMGPPPHGIATGPHPRDHNHGVTATGPQPWGYSHGNTATGPQPLHSHGATKSGAECKNSFLDRYFLNMCKNNVWTALKNVLAFRKKVLLAK